MINAMSNIEDDETLVSAKSDVDDTQIDEAPEIKVEDESEVNRLLVEEILDEPSKPRQPLSVLAAGFSDCGRRRSENADAMLVLPKERLFAVADGIGGRSGGDLASELAVEIVKRALKKGVKLDGDEDLMRPRQADELVRAIEMANRYIYKRAGRDEDYAGMGTTLTAMRIADERGRAYVAHVGDSRCYRLRGDTMEQLTRDHTRGAMLGTVGPLSGHLARAVGIDPNIDIDLSVFELEDGDLFLLCSDGLIGDVDLAEIATLCRMPVPLSQRVVKMIDRANDSGGKDNITAVLVSVVERKG